MGAALFDATLRPTLKLNGMCWQVLDWNTQQLIFTINMVLAYGLTENSLNNKLRHFAIHVKHIIL